MLHFTAVSHSDTSLATTRVAVEMISRVVTARRGSFDTHHNKA